MANLDVAATPLDIDTDMEDEDADEWQTILPTMRTSKALMKLNGTPRSGRTECLKGGIVDSDVSGREGAWALAKLSRGVLHEFVSNLSRDMVEELYTDFIATNAGMLFDFCGRVGSCQVLWVMLPDF